MADTAQARYDEIHVMLKCLDAAVANLDSAVKPIYPKHTELKKWATPTQEEYANLANNWEQYLELARSIAISPSMVRFMTGQDVRRSRNATLEDLIDPEPTRKAGKLAATSLRKFNSKISELDKTVEQMFSGCDELFQEFNKLVEHSAMQHSNDCTQLLEDIEAVARKVDTDYQTTLSYTNQSKDVPQASKTAVNHTKQLLPSLHNRATEMDDMLHNAAQARNEIAAGSLILMRSIAEITSLHHSVRTQINAINQGEEEMTTFDYLRLIQQLPYMYASFVAEAIRRKEWSAKVKVDSSTLLNEMAVFQDEELKRRRKWHKMVGSTYGPEKAENSVLGFEVNLRGDDEAWPEIAKQELDEFLSILKRNNADTGILGDITKLINELSNPTKQQSKRLKAFKNGSVHEAALGRSGLLIRGDDDLLRSLQGDKSKLEGKLRTAESRVRRLEDLLHRQTQASRPSPLGNLFQPQQNDSTGSVKPTRMSDDRRRSSTSESHDALQHRIAQLEGDLNTQRERSAILEKEANAHAEHMKGRMDEANSTKQDLLGNMEALKREFMVERRSLEDEIKGLKARLEETEDANTEDEQYQAFMAGPGNFDIDAFSEVTYRRVKEVEHTARKMTRDARSYRERAHDLAKETRDKIAFKQFKEGDLALFLPTRNQTTGAWAAFNVGCPHFFLREQEGHRLRSREWLVARITRIQERVVDLSKSLQSTAAPPSEGETDSVNTGDENDNPFDLSDGLRWWLIDAHEDKPGAPSTPGLGKSTVAANNVAAIADMHAHGRSSKGKSKLGPNGGIEGVSRTLSKSLESRRSSTGSKKALPFATGGGAAGKGSALASETNSIRAVAADSPDGTSPTAGQGVAGPSGTQAELAGDKQSTVDKGEQNERRRVDDNNHSPHPHPQQRPPVQPRTHSQQQRQSQLRREVSAASVDSQSPTRRSVVWDSLWNLDVSYPGK
ncbi:autophagy-related protein 11-domain-containing protein [Hypoxylon crocopeplum]|nr:autophagy-related protein 11-domain-containing protein [Hypoxylon crocopeplum]